MTELGKRLTSCFLSVLPNLTAEEISKINVTALSDLDSWASATLVAVIDEDFGVQLSLDHLWELGTFQAIQQYLAQQCEPSLNPDEEVR